jgi:hypothetical protein
MADPLSIPPHLRIIEETPPASGAPTPPQAAQLQQVHQTFGAGGSMFVHYHLNNLDDTNKFGLIVFRLKEFDRTTTPAARKLEGISAASTPRSVVGIGNKGAFPDPLILGDHSKLFCCSG